MMKHLSIYFIIAIAILFGCKNEKLPNKDELYNILNSRNFKLTIKYCHGGMAGSVGCWDEIMIFKNDTLTYEVDDKIHIRLLDKSRRDSLNSYFLKLIDFHQPKKNIEKDGFGCLYHDYDYTFEKDSLKILIKPQEGNGIYYKIVELLNLGRYMNIVSGLENLHQLDSIDFSLLKNQKISNIIKLIGNIDGTEKVVGLYLKTSLNDTTFSIIPSPNPGFSLKQLSPVSIYLKYIEFSDFVEMPKRYMQPVSDSDTLLNKILGLDIIKIEYLLKPKAKFIDESLVDVYGVEKKDKFLMKIYFKNHNRLIIENRGLSLDIYE